MTTLSMTPVIETMLPYTHSAPTEYLICFAFTGVALLQVCAALPLFASAGEQQPCSCRDYVLLVLYWVCVVSRGPLTLLLGHKQGK